MLTKKKSMLMPSENVNFGKLWKTNGIELKYEYKVSFGLHIVKVSIQIISNSI